MAATVLTRVDDLVEDGNLLDAPGVHFIVQQCNCLTLRAHGLSADIAARFPRHVTNPYAQRKSVGNGNLATPETRGRPGMAVWFPTGGEPPTPTIVCLLAQWRPGHVYGPLWPRYPEFLGDTGGPETAARRLTWFKRALADFKRCLDIEVLNWADAHTETEAAPLPPLVVAFPHGIGCGLGGGDWSQYGAAILTFARDCPAGVHVRIYRLDE